MNAFIQESFAGMKRYLAQLITDLEMTARHAPELSSYAFRTPFQDEDSDTGPADWPLRYTRLCDLFNLAPGAFPPVDRLTKAQVREVLLAVENLWRSWRINWHCPVRLTARPRYTLMVDWMYREMVRYHPDFGAEIDFCCYREQGVCPFDDLNACSCKKTEAFEYEDFEDWSHATGDRAGDHPASPVQELYQWLQAGEVSEFEWDYDESHERWRQFVEEEEILAWLYFYRPEVVAGDSDDEPEPAPDDFDDFDWASDSDMPLYDDDFPLPF